MKAKKASKKKPVRKAKVSKTKTSKRKPVRKTKVSKTKTGKHKPVRKAKVSKTKTGKHKPVRKAKVSRAKTSKRKPVRKAKVSKTKTSKRKPVRQAAPAPKSKAVSKRKAKKRRPPRITRMTLQEVLISLASLEGRWQELPWLEALYLHGRNLAQRENLRQVRFMVVHRGLTTSQLMSKARKRLSDMLGPVIPLHRSLEFTRYLTIIEQIELNDPAVAALLGRAVPIFVRGGQ